jgi:hypothetical protein
MRASAAISGMPEHAGSPWYWIVTAAGPHVDFAAAADSGPGPGRSARTAVRYGAKGSFMLRKQLMLVVACAAFSGTVLASGSVSAATGARSGSAKAGAVSARRSTRAAAGGRVFFTAYQNDDLPGSTVVLSGAIGDFGAGVSVLRNGKVDPEHSSQFKLALTQGSFKIVIGPLHSKLLKALSHAAYNRKTCSGHVAVTGAAPVVAGSGTGAYKGISGKFELTITANEVDNSPGCQPFHGTPLLAQTVFIAGPGTVSLH